MEIKQIKTADLIPYVNNARTHTQEQVNQICSSIKEFGFCNPVLVDSDNGIIAGHGRVMAASKLKIKEVPTVCLGHLSEAQKKAYILADNRLALDAGWDDELLAIELAALQELDFDIGLTGFSDDELAGLLAEETDGLTDEDDAPEVPEFPVSVLGDLWVLGDHRLMCGDSTDRGACVLLLGNGKADMVFTDPPYGINYQSNMRVSSDKFDVLKNDNIFLDIAPIISDFSVGWCFVWTSWKVLPDWLKQFEDFGYPSNQIIWFKGGGGIGDLKKTFSSDYETALVWHRGAELTGKRIGSVWKIEKDSSSSYVHPTQKPVALPVEAIEKTTRIGSTVLDLFGGSGSTMIACEKTNRMARLMELDPKYCDVIINRWQDYTGKQAVHENGKTFEEIKVERG